MRFPALLLAMANVLLGDVKQYDPSMSGGQVETKLVSFRYADREVPLKIYLPTSQKAPVILLSHGLGGSREVGAYLGNHWAGRGYVVVAMQHVGSDDSIWRNLAVAQRLKAMKAAAGTGSFLDRTRDVPATLDQLEKWVADPKHFLHGRMDLARIGMAGHSFGAMTTQAICGQVFGGRGPAYSDKRIKAGLPLSPSPPKIGDSKRAFGSIKIPMLLMTGTKDQSVIGRATPESRREVYAALPAGSKYELVLKGAEHMAFSDRMMTGREHRDPSHHRAIKALSTAFWDAYLKKSTPARIWLDGESPKNLLGSGDVWNRK